MEPEFCGEAADGVSGSVERLSGFVVIVIGVSRDGAWCDVEVSLGNRSRRGEVEADVSIRDAAG